MSGRGGDDQEGSPVLAYVLATGTLLVAACLMCLCLMCCAKCPEWARDRRMRRRKDKLLKNCTITKYSLKQNIKQKTLSETCAVCLDDFKDRENIIVCPCTHGYHKKCLCDWLVHSPCCPVCKESVLERLPNHEATTSNAERTPLLL